MQLYIILLTHFEKNLKNFLSIYKVIKTQKALKQNMATHTQKELKEFMPTHKQLKQNMRKIVDDDGDKVDFQDGDELKGELTELDYGIITDLGLPSRKKIEYEGQDEGLMTYIYEKDADNYHKCVVRFVVDRYKKKENGDILYTSPSYDGFSDYTCECALDEFVHSYKHQKENYDIIELKAYIFEHGTYSKHFKSKPFVKYERGKGVEFP